MAGAFPAPVVIGIPQRMKLGWLVRRNFRYGNDKLHSFRREGRGAAYVGGQLLLAALKSPYRLLASICLIPFDRVEAVRSLLKSSFWVGVVSAGVGFKYEEYRSGPSG